MKLLILLVALLSQNESLIKQGETTVKLDDLDSYVYLLEPSKRAGFVSDKGMIEKNLITMLNMNIVYDYVIDNELHKESIFENVVDLVEEKDLVLDDDFYIRLGLDQEAAHSNVRQFIVKQEYYARLLEYLKLELMAGKVNSLAKEYFLVNSSQWVIPEKRSLSIIQVNHGSEYYSDINDIYKQVAQDTDIANFEQLALKYSDDPTVELNKGNLSYFKKSDLKLPFVEEIFKAEPGIIPSIFQYKKNYYIVRVNEIKPEVKPVYADYEEQIKLQLVGELVDVQFQNIINTQAASKIEVNPELMAHVFERYKVFTEE